MDATAAAARHAGYYAGTVPELLAHKPAARIAAVIKRTGDYCRDELPAILIDRRDPIVRATADEDYE